MSNLYLRHPSRIAVESGAAGLEPPCRFAWVGDDGAFLQQGAAPLPQLAATVAQAKQVVVILAASDVTLLRIKVPKLSAARMKAALPNLVEDRLISDPADSVIVPGAPDPEGMRTIAVVQRAWLESIGRSLQDMGARKAMAVPAQLCLPHQPGVAAVAVETYADAVELVLRLSEHEGIGLPVSPEPEVSTAESAIGTIRMLVPEHPVALSVPPVDVDAYRQAADAGITVEADDWSSWMSGARLASLDMMAGLPGFGAPPFEWKRWRWPLVLLAAIVAVNLAGLYFGWWQLQREANSLRASMTETYRSVFPQETVVIDPIAQMNQKLAAARRNAGQVADDDFTALAAALGETLNRLSPQGQPAPAVAALEYRDRGLTVRFKGEAPRLEDVRTALAARNLAVTQTEAGVWQIRSAR